MHMGSDNLIMSPFNTLFMLVSGVFLLLLVVTSLLVRGKSEQTKSAVLVGACVLTMAGFVAYKIFLFQDRSFNEITASMGGFNWWGELPLQLCNINMLLLPFAVLRKSRKMMSFCFFVGPLGALMALIMPGNGFDGYSLLLPRMIGYYGTHYMILIECLALVTFGLYRPGFRDLPSAAAMIILISFVIFMINMLFRWSGLHPKANYFFSVETEGNYLLEMFYGWIPIPYLYLIPGVAILLIYMFVVVLPFEITDHIHKKRQKGEAAA